MKEVIIMSYTTSTEITGKDITPLRMPTYVPNMPAYLVEETHTSMARWAVKESWQLGLHPLQIAAHELFTRQHCGWAPYIYQDEDGRDSIGLWNIYSCCTRDACKRWQVDGNAMKHLTSVQHVATQYRVKSSQLFDVYVQLCEERGVTPY